MIELWMQKGFLPARRPKKPLFQYLFAVVFYLSSCSGASSQAGIVQATHGISTLGPTSYHTTLQPSTIQPDIADDEGTTPTQSLHQSAVSSTAQLKPSPGGSISDKFVANTHATNSLLMSVTVAATTTAAFVASRQISDKFASTTAAAQANLLYTNSLTVVPITAVHSFMPISSIVNRYATSSDKTMLQTSQIKVNNIPIFFPAATATKSFVNSLSLSMREDIHPSTILSSNVEIIPTTLTVESLITTIPIVASGAAIIPTEIHSIVTDSFIIPTPSLVKQSIATTDIFSNTKIIEASTPFFHTSDGSLLSATDHIYSTIDLGTVTETTTLFLENTAMTPSLLLHVSVSNSAEQDTVFPSLSSAVVSLSPATVTEFSTVSLMLSMLDSHTVSNAYSTEFLSSTQLEPTTFYLSPSVHSQASSSSSLNSTSAVPIPGPPHPFSSLEPSSNVLVTSTVYETTTMPPLTRQLLTSMWVTRSDPIGLPLTTQQVHTSSLSSSMEITSEFASSSIAINATQSQLVVVPPPSAATRTPSLQNTPMASLLEQASSEYITESTVFVTIDPSSTAIMPTPSLVRYNSDSATQYVDRTQRFRTPMFSSSEAFKMPVVASTPSFPSSTMFLSPTPPLTSVTTSTPYLPIKSTVAATTSLPSSVLLVDRTSSLVPPVQDVLTSSYMVTPVPSFSSRSIATSEIPPLPPIVATSGMPPVTTSVALPPVSSSSARPGGLMPSPTPVVIITPTTDSLDTSFVTKPYWVIFDISLKTHPASFDPMTPDFVEEMEGNLVRAYSAGKAEQDQRNHEVQELLENLNPDNDPLMNKRRRRAVTIDDITAQVIDISRTAANSPDATLVFYVVDGEVEVSAEECQDVMNELDDTELTHFLGVVVKGGATAYVNDLLVTTIPPPGPDTSYLKWFIPVIIIIGLCLFFCCCCWFYCFCCRVPANKRKQQDGPMDPETLKMLKFKSKYPYRPYDQTPPNQTPRGFDVAKEGLGNPGLNMEDESKKAIGTVDSTSIASNGEAKRNGPKLSKRGESIPYGKVIESSSQSSDGDTSPYVASLRSLRNDTDNLLKNTDGSSRLASRSFSPDSSANLPSRQLPMTDLSESPSHSQSQDNGNKKQKQRGGKSNQASPAKENAEEFKRLYMEAQKEISKILEPDMFVDGSLPKGKRRRSSSSGSKSKRHTTTSSSDEAHANELPETHLSRKPISPESTLEHQESLMDAKRWVHALINEAFSLVSLNANPRGNAVAPAPPDQESNTDSPKLSQNSKARANRRHPQKPVAASPSIHEEEEPPLFERRVHSPSKGPPKSPGGTPTRVVIVPVSHVPDQTAQNVMWNPYQAEDEITRLNESRQLTRVPGMTPAPKVAPKPKPRKQTSPANLNQVLPPLHNLPESSLHQAKHHLRNVRNKHSPDAASSGSESGYYPDGSGRGLRGQKRYPNRTRRSSGGSGHSSPSTPTRTSKYGYSANPGGQPETDLLSTVSKEQKIGKPIADDYDELNMRAVINSSSGQPHGLVTAVSDELMRFQRRDPDEIGPI